MASKLILLNLSVLIVSQLAVLAAHAEVHGIHVRGHAELQVEPDMARLTLQVTREAQDASALKKTLDDVTREVLKLTSSLSIAREWKYAVPGITSTRATKIVSQPQ